jgi:PAS domain S-box-containing protein
MVKELGYSVVGTATTSAEALERAAETQPDLVLMDIQLSGDRDGIDAARELRQRYNLAVVFLTAYADPETVERTQEVGAAGYLVKPFSQPDLRAALATAFSGHRTLQRAQAGERSLSTILHSMAEAIVVTDSQGVITFLNPAAAELTGWGQEEATNQQVVEVVRVGQGGGVFWRAYARAVDNGRAVALAEVDLQSRDRRQRPVEVEFEPLLDADGTRSGLVMILRCAGGGPALDAAELGPVELRHFGAGTRMLIYSHDTFGLGHLQRCLNISRALIARFPGLSILLVTGSPAVHRYNLPPGLDYVKLPAVRKVASDKYEARTLRMSYDGIVKLRRNLLLRTVRDFNPNVLLVDHAPAGMKGEMLPALEWLGKNTPCIKIMGLRDIIDDPVTVKETWREQGTYQVLEKLYDHIVVYGSEDVFDPVTAYGFTPDLETKTTFCNYIQERPLDEPHSETDTGETRTRPQVVVTIGGGDGAGEVVIGSYLEMLRDFRSDVKFDSIILTGPFISPSLASRFRRECQDLPATLHEFVSSTSPFLQRADLVVSTGGYNTITQTLSRAKRALVIPRILHRREQLIRAAKLAELGIITLLHPDDVTPERFHEQVTSLLGNPEEPLARAREEQLIQFDGTERLADFCSRLLVSCTPVQETVND